MAQVLARVAEAGIGDYEADEPTAYLWPECVPAWNAFGELIGQWADGRLPYADVLAHLREMYPDDAERRDVYEGVRACEHAVREVYAERRRRNQRASG